MITFGSICSGIEAASVAMLPLGITPAWYSEIEPFCCSLLEHHYKDVPNFGDITQIKKAPCVDIIIGGTPCQSFSVNGNRQGMDDIRGQLALAYAKIVLAVRPRWLIWENVPGVLSTNNGRDFGSFIRALEECGYGWSYRTCDVRGVGIPHRRRRVFLVGHYGNWRPAAAVLFDKGSCSKDGEAIEETQDESELAFPRIAGEAFIGWTGDETPKYGLDCVPTLRAHQGGEGVGVISPTVFRRITAKEWERLQGFPDDYTKIEFRGKPASDRVRTTALGNSFCVAIVRWIANRILILEGAMS